MDAPKCRLCGAKHYGSCPPGSFGGKPAKAGKCAKGLCNAETYLARIAVLEAKLSKLQGIKTKRKPK